jgi:hypothetical protein
MPKKLTRLKITEVSSVDAGAGEGVKIMLMKREENEEKYPTINNARDLQAAVQAIGRAQDPDKFRQYIRDRARALGMTPAFGAFGDAHKAPYTSPSDARYSHKRNEPMTDELIQITKSHDVSDVVEIMKINGVSNHMGIHEHLIAFASLNKLAGESTQSAYVRILEDPANVELRKAVFIHPYDDHPDEMRKLGGSSGSSGGRTVVPAGSEEDAVLDGERRAVRQATRCEAREALG